MTAKPECTAPTSTTTTNNDPSSFSKPLMYRDNADNILPVSVDPHASNRDDQIRQVARVICPFLSDDGDNAAAAEVSVVGTKASELHVKPLLGGLSNELFIVSKVGATPSVLVRIHPPEAQEGTAVVDRKVENRLVAWLSRERMAPTFYGRFENGRVEELYTNVSPLSSAEMKAYGPKIAVALADFHSLEAPTNVLPKPHQIPSRYDTVDLWIRSIQQNTASSPQDVVSLVHRIQSEWKWLRAQLLEEPPTRTGAQLRALQFIREMVVTHMDCQSLNVLKDSNATNGQGPIRLIDFEYAGWNPRASDLANTFCEYCDMNNICADYAAEYPSEQAQNVFLKAYMERCRRTTNLVEREEEWDEVLETLRSEIGRFTLLSHLGWAAWAIVMVQETTIDFDYIAYAKHRMDGYDFGKKQLFSNDC